MDKHIFGMKAQRTTDAVVADFDEKNSKLGGNYNPYNKDFFNHPENISLCKDQGRITSIPSPYARMHITDLAFQESNCGIGVVADHERAKIALSADYTRAMSHCLDIFELLYHADEMNLTELGFSLHKLDLVSTHSVDPAVQAILKDPSGELNSLGRYIQTLDLYRDAYMEAIRKRNVPGYKFDFTSLYVFKHNGKVIGSTSPFTGFYAKADCDLDKADIKIDGRKILSADILSWRTLKQRRKDFREFLYLLLRDTGLKDIYSNLFIALKDSFTPEELNAIDLKKFNEVDAYRKFNVEGQGLQQLPVENDNVFIRPDGLDCSYLKFLLYLQNPVDLTIRKEEYSLPIKERRFNNEFVRWIGVNDILADALFILPYEVNDNYEVVSYKDMAVDGKLYRRCLVPIKREVLDIFKMEDILDNLTIVRQADGKTYSVALKVKLANGDSIVLRREYRVNGAQFPDGVVISGAEMKPFAFGVYPFVKSANDLNIYKVLFYNVFEKPYHLDFFYRDAETGKITIFLENDHQQNKTNDIRLNATEFPVNCEYHHLEKKEGFEFAELTLEGDGNKYTALIVPKLRVPHPLIEHVNVAIDLGTSNTYIAYSAFDPSDDTGDITINAINTHHIEANGEWNELTFMNRRCANADLPDAPDRNRDDLILKLSDAAGAKASAEFLDHQLCEFIPSRIDPSSEDEDNYQFPIPSVLNFLRVDGNRVSAIANANPSPLLHTAIPFAYYERGTRQGAQPTYYDKISDGSQFKWFIRRDDNGDNTTNKTSKAAFKAFVRELLFIVRCHIISQGYSLKGVNVYWSYPLSFNDDLVDEYTTIWNEAYRDLINRVRREDVPNYVHYTNESRSPIYDVINPAAADRLTLLVDIGGGSTDIIGYKRFQPLFITSFGFAGNALYLDSQLNSVEGNVKDTILYKYIQRTGVIPSKKKATRLETQAIDLDAPISTLMNYGFSKSRTQFEGIFRNEAPKFMLLLHNSALIYHIAQLSKIKSPDEMPVEIYLTGNGSKQFQLNKEYKDMIRNIFEYVYSEGITDEEELAKVKRAAQSMRVATPSRPKVATAHGLLKGLRKKIALDADSHSGSVVMAGDATTVVDRTRDGGQLQEDPSKGVRANVDNFIDMFYKIVYPTKLPRITKEQLRDAAEYQSGNHRLEVKDNALINDSLFLQYIALIMEKISLDLALRE